MRIHVVGINYSPEPTGIAVYTTGLAEYLARGGHCVKVFTGFPYYPRWAKASEHRRKLFARYDRNGVQVRRHYLYVPVEPTALSRLFHELSFVMSACVGYAVAPKADLTIVIAPPLFLGLPILLLARIKRSQSILHVQDLQPDAAVDLGMLKPGILTTLLFALERATYRIADKVSTISLAMLEQIRSKGIPKQKLGLLRNWANDDVVVPMKTDTAYRKKWDLQGKLVVLYSGNLGVKQGLSCVVEAATKLRDHEEIAIVVVGDGAEREHLINLATKAKLPNLRFYDLQPIERLGELLATADIAIVPQKAGVKDLVLPSKIANLLASERPIIAAATSDTEFGKLITEAKCGVLIAPEDGDQLTAAILSMAGDPTGRATMGTNGRKYMLEHLTSAAILGEFGNQFLDG